MGRPLRRQGKQNRSRGAIRTSHPAPRSGEGGPPQAVGGACASTLFPNLGAIDGPTRPLHHAPHGPPPPLRFTPRGRISDIVLATRFAPEFCRRLSTKNFAARDRRQTSPAVGPVWSRSAQRTKEKTPSPGGERVGVRGFERLGKELQRLLPLTRSLSLATSPRRGEVKKQTKKEAERRKAQSPTAAPCGAALPLRGQHASRRSTAVLAKGTAHPEGSAQARLRGRRHQKRRVAPASAAPTSSDAPRAPVLVPAGMMPEPPECAGDEPNARGHRTRSISRRHR